MTQFDLSNWGISKELRRNIILAFLLVLLTQLSAVCLYFRTELDRAQGRYEAMQEEYRKCMEDATVKVESLKNEHIKAIQDAQARQDALERRLLGRLKR